MTNKKTILSICLVLISICFSLFFAEIAVRFLVSSNLKIEKISERPSFFYSPKDSVTMRGNDPMLSTANTLFKVAVVGDSFTFAPGMQFDDAFPNRLDRMFQLDKKNAVVRVMNFGTPGASTRDEVMTVRKALDFGAQTIILQITLNDPQREPFRKLQGEFTDVNSSNNSFFQRFLLKSQLYRFVASRLHNAQSVTRYIEYHKDLFFNPQTWDVFEKSIREIHELVITKNARLGIVLFPLFDFPLDENYPFKDIHSKVASLAHTLASPFLDLFPAYKGSDSHPNEIAHRIASEQMYKWLVKEELVPANAAISKEYKMRRGLFEKSIKK